ncbi:PHB depolymerase family esterase [Actinocorallia sp. B10E7]|uniref:alpha/beta hydrolase family esterase n=1 Tax=Actinocorallia sp. B10E7 TaxID=3153558 RepID=UPI00325DA498
MRRLLAILLTFVVLCACSSTGSEEGGRPGPSRSGEKAPNGPQRPAEQDGIPTAAGTHRLELEVGTPGHREYRLRVPPRLRESPRPLPLVLAVHGGASNAEKFEALSGFDEVADEKGFLVAYPEGFAFSWNAGPCCGPAKLARVDDVGFLEKLIDRLVQAGVADPERVYVSGFSNGGGMAYRMACEGPGRVRAIGVVSAALVIGCDPDRPVSVMIVHGKADRSVPYRGGGQRDFNDKRPFTPVSHAVGFWRKAAGAGSLRGDGSCRTGRGEAVVRFCPHPGGHVWPGGTAARLWAFFSSV